MIIFCVICIETGVPLRTTCTFMQIKRPLCDTDDVIDQISAHSFEIQANNLPSFATDK